jgi:integrase
MAFASYAVDPLGKIAGNPCEGIKRIYAGDRSEIIWTDADIAQLKKAGGSRKAGGKLVELPCPAEMVHAVDLASHTGLREGDLARVSWSHVREDAIILASGKNLGRREAIIPLYDELRNVLARIPKRSTTILTNHRGHPWKPNSLASAFIRAKASAGMADRDLHFHDLRGTAATRFYIAGLSIRVIAEKPNSRTLSKIRLKAGSGTRHIVRYVSRKGSHMVVSSRAGLIPMLVRSLSSTSPGIVAAGRIVDSE